MKVFILVQVNTNECWSFMTEEDVEKFVQGRDKKDSLQWKAKLGSNYAEIVIPGNSGYSTTIYKLYGCDISEEIIDEIRNFAREALKQDGPERDAIRDILKK